MVVICLFRILLQVLFVLYGILHQDCAVLCLPGARPARVPVFRMFGFPPQDTAAGICDKPVSEPFDDTVFPDILFRKRALQDPGGELRPIDGAEVRLDTFLTRIADCPDSPTAA